MGPMIYGDLIIIYPKPHSIYFWRSIYLPRLLELSWACAGEKLRMSRWGSKKLKVGFGNGSDPKRGPPDIFRNHILSGYRSLQER